MNQPKLSDRGHGAEWCTRSLILCLSSGTHSLNNYPMVRLTGKSPIFFDRNSFLLDGVFSLALFDRGDGPKHCPLLRTISPQLTFQREV